MSGTQTQSDTLRVVRFSLEIMFDNSHTRIDNSPFDNSFFELYAVRPVWRTINNEFRVERWIDQRAHQALTHTVPLKRAIRTKSNQKAIV